MEERSWTPERLAQYRGPKIGTHLRREIKQHAALLYEKVTLLRLLDPEFEEELETLGAVPFLDRCTELIVQESDETSEKIARIFEESPRHMGGVE